MQRILLSKIIWRSGLILFTALILSQILVLPAVLPISSVASSDNDKSVRTTKMSGILNTAVSKAQQDRPGTINGAVNPELIPNRTAYTLLFRALTAAPDIADLSRERERSFIANMGLTGRPVDDLLVAAEDFRKQVSELDRQVADIKDRNWPNPSPAVMELLAELQKEKEAIVDTLVASLPNRLGHSAELKLRDHIENNFKRKIKLGPPAPIPTTRHHALLRPSGSQFIRPASFDGSEVSHSHSAAVAGSVQGMGYGAMYSDTWVNSSWSRIWGCGVTEDYYNGYGHQYYVTTTLTSPMGRTASATSYTSSSYAYVDVKLDWPFDDGDLGEYLTTTEHKTLCPYIGFWVTWANTREKVLVGISVACYKFVGVDPDAALCIYMPVDGCNCKCFSPAGRRLSPPPGKTCVENPWLSEKIKWTQPVYPDGTKGPVNCAQTYFGQAYPTSCFDCFDIGTIP